VKPLQYDFVAAQYIGVGLFLNVGTPDIKKVIALSLRTSSGVTSAFTKQHRS
jgi:hypothetical protein